MRGGRGDQSILSGKKHAYLALYFLLWKRDLKRRRRLLLLREGRGTKGIGNAGKVLYLHPLTGS